MLKTSSSHQKKNIINSVPGSDLINIKKHLDEYTVKTERGDYIRCYELSGFEFQTASHNQLVAWALLKKRMLKAISHPDISIWTHLIHEKYVDSEHFGNVTLPAKFNKEIAQTIYDEYRKGLDNVYVNRFFISIVMRGIDSLDSLRGLLDKKGVQNNVNQNIKRLEQRAKVIEMDLSGVNIRPLIMKERNGHVISEISEFYGRLYNGYWKEMPVTFSDLNNNIPLSGLFLHKETIEQRGINESQYGAILTVKDYDGNNNLHQFDDLLGLPFPFIMTQSFTFLSHLKAAYVIDNVKKEQKAAGENSDTEDELNDLLKALSSGDSVLGSFHTTLFSSATDIKEAANNLDEAESILRKGGVITQRALLDAEPCFLAQLPGNFKEITYAVPITNDNFSMYAFMYNTPLGKKDGNHWGDAVCLGKTASNNPRYINWHEDDVGHTTILGGTGSGKTVQQNLLLMFSQKFNPTLTIFDSKRNAEVLVTALDGFYYNIELGENTGFAPFQMEPNEKNKLYLKDLVQMMAEFVEDGLTIEQINEISWAVDSLLANEVPLESRSISSLIKFFPNQGEGNLHDRLTMWTKNYKYGWIFDNKKDTLDVSNKVIGFNMDNLMNTNNTNKSSNISSLITSYLWHRTEEKKTGEKGIIVFEEYHQLLSHPLMIEKMSKGLKMDRDKNILYVFTSQSVSDALKSEISSAIKEQIGTYFLLSNPRGVLAEYSSINITEEEFNVIKTADRSSRVGIYKQGNDSVIMNFDLSIISKFIPILSSNKQLINLFEKCKREHKKDWLLPYLKEAKNV